MSHAYSIWSASKSCDAAARWLEERLAAAGLRSIQTFDLHDARLGAADCPCPNHGTDACDCQMLVLLVYPGEAAPVTLVLHGHDGESWVSVIDSPEQRADGAALVAIERALVSGAFSQA